MIKLILEDMDASSDDKRNWVQLMFYYNEKWHNPDDKLSGDVCNMIKTAYEKSSGLLRYDYPQDYYNSEKKRLIDMYSDFPVTKVDNSKLSVEEQIRLRQEVMLAELAHITPNSDNKNNY